VGVTPVWPPHRSSRRSTPGTSAHKAITAREWWWNAEPNAPTSNGPATAGTTSEAPHGAPCHTHRQPVSSCCSWRCLRATRLVRAGTCQRSRGTSSPVDARPHTTALTPTSSLLSWYLRRLELAAGHWPVSATAGPAQSVSGERGFRAKRCLSGAPPRCLALRTASATPQAQGTTTCARLHRVRALTRKASMRSSLRIGLTALMAAMLLASALSTASARNLEVSNQRFRVTWSRIELGSSSFTIRCQLTLEGSMHSRTIPKIERLLVGAITRIHMKEESCTGGVGRPEQPPPWHISYEGFTGTLPSISTVRFLSSRWVFAVIALGVTCKYGTSTQNITGSISLNGSGEAVNEVPLAGRNVANLLEGGGFCPATATMTSESTDGVITVLNSTERIRIRLI